MPEYIERRKVSNACYEVFEDVVSHPKQLTAEEVRQTLLRFEKAINGVPAADVAPVVHGRWIRRGNEKKCSVCGFIYYSNNDEWNGCPNCLAKMDGR